MIVRLAAAAVLAALWGCSGGGSSGRMPVSEVFVESERAPAQSAGWCQECNAEVYEGHRCGLTVPCALCKREAGARHLHEVAWKCEKDDFAMAREHECGDPRQCATCREDKRAFLGPIGCERCARMIPPVALRGITTYCGTCNLEVGANHVHGKTVYCRPCLREAGKNHVCDATRYCPEHGEEHAPDHVHGTTQYCERCHREAGQEHRHGETEWCWRCGEEKEWPHSHHDD